MRVGEDGYCTFPDGRAVPPPEATRALKMLPGVNALRFEMRFPRDKRVLVAECFVFLWSAADARVIAVDIDGTITRSDLPGLLMTFSPGTIDHTHEGVCACLNWITDAGAQVLYLTSRPITLASKTRNFLMNLRQDGMLLPLGPLITSKSSVSGVLFKELVLKDMHIFKSAALLDIVHVFRRAGPPPVFVAGIGNRDTDGLAYLAAGVPPEYIYINDPTSAIQRWSPSTA
ncbi:unnamed protein product, partial [Phaeothamnion confervicola]